MSRLAAAAWLGAASLFVVVALREVRYSEFETPTKDVLAVLRFPAYYAFGFSLITAALGGVFLASMTRTPQDDASGNLRIWISGALLGVALAIMIGDYVAVYRPLVEMITPPGRPRTPEFLTCHRLSVLLNMVGLGFCAAAAVLLCWPQNAGFRANLRPRADREIADAPFPIDDRL